MRTFSTQDNITAVKRQVYTNNKSVLTATGNVYTCALRALAADEAAINGMQWGTAYSVILETGADIKTGDVLTINGSDYTIKGVATYGHANVKRATDYMKCLATKTQT